MARLVQLFSSPHLPQAHLAHQLLERAGIPSTLQGINRSGLGGMIPMSDSEVSVWVRAEDLAEARKLLGVTGPAVEDGRLSLAAQEGSGELSLVEGGGLSAPGGPAFVHPEACPRCQAPWERGFEVCWNCSEELADAAD